MLPHAAFRFRPLLVLGLLGLLSLPAHAQEPDSHPSDYLVLSMRPSTLLEPSSGTLDVNLHLSAEGEPDPVCTEQVDDTTDPPTTTRVCTDVLRPPIYGTWDLRAAAGAGDAASERAVLGTSCMEPLTDLVSPSDGTTFTIESENDLLFDLVPLTLCADDLEEGSETFEIVFTLSLDEDLTTPFFFDVILTLEDATQRRQITVTGGDDVDGRELHFTEGDLGDPCRPVDLIVTLSQTDNTEVSYFRFGVDTFARNAELGVDFRFTPPADPAIDVGDPARRFTVACIIGDDTPEPDELFNIWIELVGKPWTRVVVPITIVDDEPRPHVPGFLTFEFGGQPPGTFIEGDEETPGLPMVVRYADGELRSFEMIFRVVTLDGTARAGEDYEPIDREFVFPVGHFGIFDIDDQMRLRIIPDLMPEAPLEVFYLAVYAILPNGELYFSEILEMAIEDDDLIGGLGADGSNLWIGSDPADCPSPVVSLDLPEPSPDDVPFVDYTVDVYARLSQTGEEGGTSCGRVGGRFTAPVRLLTGGLAGQEPALVGNDVSFTLRPQEPLLFEALDHHAQVFVRVYSDQALEPDEYATLSLSLGYHGYATMRLRIVDFQKGERLVGNRDASFARMGRVMASMLSEALTDRFSCARAKGCRAGGAPAIGARNGLGQLASVVRSLAPPRAPASDLRALARPGGRRPLAERPLIERVGSRIDGLSLQASPSGWFGPREAPGRSKWSAWARSEYLYASDSSPDGTVQRTSMLGLLGGVDRRFNVLTIGSLYGLAWAEYSSRYSADLARAEGVEAGVEPFLNAMSWQLIAPYVGVQPHDRIRSWVSYGRTLFGSWEPSLSYQPDVDFLADEPRYSFTVAGASITALRARGFVIDVEGDWFVVGTRLPTCPAACRQTVLSLVPDSKSRPGAEYPTTRQVRNVLALGEDIGIVDERLGGVGRRRVGLRFGVPLGGRGGRTLSVAFSRRWDTGPDVVWLFGGHDRVHAYDVGFDVRLSPAGSRLSASLNGRMELRRATPVVDRQLRHRERAVGGAIRWGRVETVQGWSVILRPRYGYPGVAGSLESGSMAALLPDFHPAARPMPLVDLSAGYGFEDGARLVLRGSRGFGERVRGASLGAGVNYERGW